MSSLRWGKLLPIQRTYSRPNASKRMSYSSDNFDTDTLSELQSFLEGKVSNSNENEKPSTSTKKRSDGLYFDDDAGVVFQVETTLYRVPPSDLIKVSPVFRDMFKMSSASESRNDDNPIFLKSISRIDWERLLKVILHKSFLDPPFRFEMEEWISVLKLSTLWRMGVVRAIAIEKIEQLDDPARRIQLAREYGISSYYLPALVRLVIRVNPLSAQDFKYLGCECALNIAYIRERVNPFWNQYGVEKWTYSGPFFSKRKAYVGYDEENAQGHVEKEILIVFEDHKEFLT